MPSTRRATAAFAVAACALAGLAACGGGKPAGPVRFGGVLTRLVAQQPCEFNGDSGCRGPTAIRRSDPQLCLRAPGRISVVTGADARSVTVSAGRWKNRGSIGLSKSRQIPLIVRRTSDRHFDVDIPRDFDPDTEAFLINVHYKDGVKTPYPVYESTSAFTQGTYAVLTTRPPATGSPCRRRTVNPPQ